jgi:hypothetical protein
MKFIFSSLLFLPVIFLGQTSNKGIILSKETKSPVPFATVKVLHQPRGVIASEKGDFMLEIDLFDSVMISSVGYETKILIGKEIDSIIYLTPKIKSMAEVIVGKKHLLRTIILGNGANYLNKTIRCRLDESGPKDDCWPWGPGFEKDEFAERIDLPDSSLHYVIKKIIIPVTRKCKNPLLLHIYNADPNSEFPGEELLRKAVHFKFLAHNKALVDISNDNITLHATKSFFIGFGWVWGEDGEDCDIHILLKKMEKGNTYSRTLGSKDYYWFNFSKHRNFEKEEYTVASLYAVKLDEMK